MVFLMMILKMEMILMKRIEVKSHHLPAQDWAKMALDFLDFYSKIEYLAVRYLCLLIQFQRTDFQTNSLLVSFVITRFSFAGQMVFETEMSF